MTRGPRTAIIDIGSNSIRLVVYQGPVRLPTVLFNEKVLAGLGRGLAARGTIDPDSIASAERALARFAMLAREMEATSIRTVATAAVRDAANGRVLIDAAEAVGLEVELLSGDQEARGAGYGVISAMPEADGIVGDLGGGSLELVRIENGEIGDRASFPLGVLRLAAIRKRVRGQMLKHVRETLSAAGWLGACTGLPFYLVGGSWRSLARLDIHELAYPMPVLHGYTMTADRIDALAERLRGVDKAWLKTIPHLSSGRMPTLAGAADLLSHLLRVLGSTRTVVSAFGLREGLLYERLSPQERAEDPLIAAARDEGKRLGRFAEHGDVLDRWIAPLFAGESAAEARLRHAACLLADTSWRANPEFRVERGVEIALHGNWVGIDARGRAMVAAALAASLGASRPYPAPIEVLASPEDIARAGSWGLAIRLAQRLSGGVAAPLDRTRITLDAHTIALAGEAAERALWGEAVEKRLKALATALGRRVVMPG